MNPTPHTVEDWEKEFEEQFRTTFSANKLVMLPEDIKRFIRKIRTQAIKENGEQIFLGTFKSKEMYGSEVIGECMDFLRGENKRLLKEAARNLST